MEQTPLPSVSNENLESAVLSQEILTRKLPGSTIEKSPPHHFAAPGPGRAIFGGLALNTLERVFLLIHRVSKENRPVAGGRH